MGPFLVHLLTMVPLLGPLFVLAFVPMLLENQISRRNHAWLLEAGATEPSDDVYPVMLVAYPASFLAMLVEAFLRESTWTPVAVAGGVVFVAAKALKYWAIATLGPRWTFRVLVPPGSVLTRTGPYRYARHPNYVGVMGELIGYALLAGAPVSGTLASAVFAAILLARIRVEERALGVRSR